jgi:diguanylate cyclase
MVAIAPIPPDEKLRLAELHSYAVLDTPPDERFELFCRLCTWLFQVPVAAINLVDAERTFFKSLIGVDRYQPARATSICAHAVGEGNPIMIVEDLTKDPRFHDHPLTTKGLVFYAGALLKTASGRALGTLCIGDTCQRSLTPEDSQKLLELAAGVTAVLDLHRSSLTLRRIAEQDTLTGLYNRRAFVDAVERAVQASAAGADCALLFLDLDRFKPINDTYGHVAGDALLCEVGCRLTATVRAGDTVARLGGDEFAILIEHAPTPSGLEDLALRVLASFAQPFAFEGIELPIRTSIGITTYESTMPGLDAATLMRRADEALYAAKREGRSRFAWWR